MGISALLNVYTPIDNTSSRSLVILRCIFMDCSVHITQYVNLQHQCVRYINNFTDNVTNSHNNYSKAQHKFGIQL